MFIDFAEVKRLTTILAVAEWLKLPIKNNRCQCPINEGEKREIAITPEKGLYKCFGCDVGGDMISLAAHVLQVDQKKAAAEIMAHFHGYKPAAKGLPPEGLDYLDAGHESVVALGISKEKALQLGIGFAPRGTMRNHVLIPLRDLTGVLLGYAGIPVGTPVKLPSNLLK